MGEGAAVGVHVQHDLAGRGRWEVEGGLAAGEGAGGHGPADVERLGAAEVGELLGTGAEGLFEVQSVDQVELAVEVDGAVEGDLVGVHVEVPRLGRLPSGVPRQRRGRTGLGVVDGPLELR